MTEFTKGQIERYLSSVFHAPVSLLGVTALGKSDADTADKGYGYGNPLRLDFQVNGGRRKAVLHTMSRGPFGHERMADRARILLWEHEAFNRLPHHARSLDAGAVLQSGEVLSLGGLEEICSLTEYVEGAGYFLDLERIRDTDAFSDLDLARADALCDYLVEIHRVQSNEAGLYTRRIRELVGDGECIMGLADSYPPHPILTPALLEEIERRCVQWRWRLKNRVHRLCQVHGDFHPWNILFGAGTDFRLLDRSRGEYGDAADDATCLSINYLFFSLQRHGRLEGKLELLFRRFWDRYLEQSSDQELLEVAAPFFVFRGLVLASPVWYPHLEDRTRWQLVRFMMAVLEHDAFDPAKVNDYCGD
jgi:hypothetical protein